jgi:Flp pilus assembly protein TadB
MPIHFYHEKGRQCSKEISWFLNRSRISLIVKLLSFFTLAWTVYLCITSPTVEYFIIVLLLFIIYMIAFRIDEKCKREVDELRRIAKACDNEIKALNGDFTAFDN